MTRFVATAVMALAVRCLGDHRREWAFAMEAEFEAAAEDGRPLAFAIGCLAAAWRGMPTHAEGRFVLASHALAIGLLVPMAALLLMGVLFGFPHLPAIGGGPEPIFTDAHWSAVPSLAGLVLLLGVGRLLLAWALLDRDWARVAVIGRLNAAVAATLVTFAGVLFLDDTRALLQAAALAVELIIVATMACWHDRLSAGA